MKGNQLNTIENEPGLRGQNVLHRKVLLDTFIENDKRRQRDKNGTASPRSSSSSGFKSGYSLQNRKRFRTHGTSEGSRLAPQIAIRVQKCVKDDTFPPTSNNYDNKKESKVEPLWYIETKIIREN